MLLKQTNIPLKDVMTVKIDFNKHNFDQPNHITCEHLIFFLFKKKVCMKKYLNLFYLI